MFMVLFVVFVAVGSAEPVVGAETTLLLTWGHSIGIWGRWYTVVGRVLDAFEIECFGA